MRCGSGDPLLLVHGLGATGRVWEPVIDRLAEERDVIAVDLPGFGGSPPLPDGVAPSAPNLAAALARFCEAEGVPLPHVAGNSLGGWIALELGRAGGAASVTALSPAGLWRSPLGPRRFDARRWARRLRPLVAALLRTRRGRGLLLGSTAAHPERIPAPEARALVLSWIDSPAYEAANREMRAVVFDPGGYPEIPVTLAWGDRDRIVGPPRRERAPLGARVLTLPAVGHTPTWDDPGLVSSVLLEGSARSASPV